MRALLFLLPLLSSGWVQAQYQETFDTPNKGIVAGPCTTNALGSCASTDFSGVDWTITGTLIGLQAFDDYFRTQGGAMTAVDVDEEICWVSPQLVMSGTASFSMDLTWIGYDDYNLAAVGSRDYIDVAYRIDGGSWVTLPNAVGGGPRTVAYVGSAPNDGSLTGFGASGLTGGTLDIRVCIDVNASGEVTTIDNVSAVNADLPGIAVPPGAPTAVVATAGNAQATVSWTAPSDDGGSPITGYTVTSSPGGLTCSIAGATSCVVTGLTNGTAYTFTVIAANSQGNGPASAPSNLIVPSALIFQDRFEAAPP